MKFFMQRRAPPEGEELEQLAEVLEKYEDKHDHWAK